jgi:hypothetical protein
MNKDQLIDEHLRFILDRYGTQAMDQAKLVSVEEKDEVLSMVCSHSVEVVSRRKRNGEVRHGIYSLAGILQAEVVKCVIKKR